MSQFITDDSTGHHSTPPPTHPYRAPQMFCTQCHVAFSWRTGAVVTNGVIHK